MVTAPQRCRDEGGRSVELGGLALRPSHDLTRLSRLLTLRRQASLQEPFKNIPWNAVLLSKSHRGDLLLPDV